MLNEAQLPGGVLLLRSASEDNGPDKYEEAFRARGYRALSIPVLETVHTNTERLANVVRAGGLIAQQTEKGYAGVIVTSGRACEAWRLVVEQLAMDGRYSREGALQIESVIQFRSMSATQKQEGGPRFLSTPSAKRLHPHSPRFAIHSPRPPTARTIYVGPPNLEAVRSSLTSLSPTCRPDQKMHGDASCST